MGRKVSLKGRAAKAFMDNQMGVPATTDEDRAQRVLAQMELGLKDGTEAGRLGAGMLLMTVARSGLEEACKVIVARPKDPPSAS